MQILPPSERRRVRIVQRPEKARYFLTNYRWQYTEVVPYLELKALRVSGLKIMGIYLVDCDHPFSLTFWTSCASYLKGPRDGATPEQLADFKAKMDENSRAAARCGYSGFGFDRCQEQQSKYNTCQQLTDEYIGCLVYILREGLVPGPAMLFNMCGPPPSCASGLATLVATQLRN